MLTNIYQKKNFYYGRQRHISGTNFGVADFCIYDTLRGKYNKTESQL